MIKHKLLKIYYKIVLKHLIDRSKSMIMHFIDYSKIRIRFDMGTAKSITLPFI